MCTLGGKRRPLTGADDRNTMREILSPWYEAWLFSVRVDPALMGASCIYT